MQNIFYNVIPYIQTAINMEVYEEGIPAKQVNSSIIIDKFQYAIGKLSEIEKSFDKVIHEQEEI